MLSRKPTRKAAPVNPRLPRGSAPLVIAVLAIVAIVFGAHSVSTLNQATPASAPVVPPADTPAATPSASPAPSTAVPAPTAAAPVPTAAAPAPTAPAPAATAGPVDPISADEAERQSERFAEEAQDTEGDGDERLTQELRDAASAYRDAARAAAAGDGAAFSAALARADQLARQATVRLDD
jgi:hypothetical protein